MNLRTLHSYIDDNGRTTAAHCLAYFVMPKYNRNRVKNGGDIMDYLTGKEIGEKWGVTARMVNYYCSAGRIKGAVKKGNLWLVPVDTEKPKDGRRKEKDK